MSKSETCPEALAGYPVVAEIPVAWGEMDAYNHVNNVVYFRYFETVRMHYFERIGYRQLKDKEGLGPILAETQCRFRRPVSYPDLLLVAARAEQRTPTGFVMQYAIYSQQFQDIAATGSGRIVSYDYQAGAKVALPAAIVQAMDELEALSA